MPMPATDPRMVARLYQETRERVLALMTGPDDALWHMAVPACPGWSAHDVVAHMTAVAEDWAAGSLAGPPTDEQTAAHVTRFSGYEATGLMDAWRNAAARLDDLAATNGVEPPLGDIVCHEHDIRGAIGRAGARDSAAVWHTSDRLLTILDTPVPLRITVEDGEYRSGPDDKPEIELRTTRFEALRWRTGRRSRAQLAAMEWSNDPAPVLDHLCLFGPANADLVE